MFNGGDFLGSWRSEGFGDCWGFCYFCGVGVVLGSWVFLRGMGIWGFENFGRACGRFRDFREANFFGGLGGIFLGGFTYFGVSFVQTSPS